MKKVIIFNSKLVQIQHCGDCPNRFYEGNDLYCELTTNHVYENGNIPKDCPLPDVK